MPHSSDRLAPGLYFVATPIGAARDITLRALDILTGADAIAAEDTRTTRKLMDIHGVALNGRPLIAYHDHNGSAQRPRLLAMLREGLSVACVSDAGTPLVSDPGYGLARAAIAGGLTVRAAPGASAMLAALTVSGLPSDRFFFAGFAPNAQGPRRGYLKSLATVPGTLIFYESPKRVGKLLDDMVHTLGAEREAAVCRELTKKFEQTRRGTLAELADFYTTEALRGEVVVVVDRPGAERVDDSEIVEVLKMYLAEGSVKDAVAAVTEAYGLKRREVYRMALDLERRK